jgi:hypothetical protein
MYIICVYTYIYIIYTSCRKVWFAKSLYTVVGFDCSLSFWGLLEYVYRYNQQIPRIWKWVCLKTIDPERSSEVFLKFKRGKPSRVGLSENAGYRDKKTSWCSSHEDIMDIIKRIISISIYLYHISISYVYIYIIYLYIYIYINYLSIYIYNIM